MNTKRLFALANSLRVAPSVAKAAGVFESESYELALPNGGSEIDADGWALIAPFGEWPKTRVYREGGQVKEQQFLQVLDNESVAALLSAENGLFRKLRRATIGIPTYKGHGDLNDADPQAIPNETRKIKLGVVDQVREGARGVEAHFALDNDGADAVAAGWKYPSAFWYVLPISNSQGVIRCRPIKLISVALTQFPNISGVESLANARPTEPAVRAENQETKDQEMKSLIIGWLAAKGIVLANDANDAQVLEAIQRQATEAITATTALGNDKNTLSGQVTSLTNERNGLQTQLQQNQTALSNEQSARKAERTGRAVAVADLAIYRGIITVADRESQITALANSADFDKDATALLEKQPAHKTTRNNMAESGKQGAALDNERANALSEYDTAFKAELPNAGQDPVKAHRMVLSKYPALAAKLMPKK